MKKEHEVVMLSTDKASSIVLNTINNRLLFDDDKSLVERILPIHGKNQELYIISNDEIKEGFKGWAVVTVRDDARIHYLVEVLVAEQNQCYCKEDRKFSFEHYSVKAVIATTNNKISVNLGKEKWLAPTNSNYDQVYTRLCPYPQIPQSFINHFVTEFNKDNQITKVMVEYDCDHSQMPNKVIDVLKLNPDNTINISNVEKTWKNVMDSFYVGNADNIQKWSDEKRLILEYNLWLEKNYKSPNKLK